MPHRLHLATTPLTSPRGTRATCFEVDVCDDALLLILASLPADSARAAFCVSTRWSKFGGLARQMRLKSYWRALFRTDLGFPDVALLTMADCLRFEARLANTEQCDRPWRCLSCLRPAALRLGDFCIDCVGNEDAFVPGNGGYVDSAVTCGHKHLVYWCALCEASCCRTCLMQGACTFCLLLQDDAPACAPCEL